MSSLDDQNAIAKLDPAEMRTRIAELPDQIEKALETFKAVVPPTHYVQAKNVIILGMGGSAIGGELAAALSADSNPLPVEIRRDYDLPAYVGNDSLVIGVSYSGNTEETLSGFRAAATKGAKLIAVTGGGELASLARKFKAPIFPIEYESVPRAALGYLLTAGVVIFQKLRLHSIADQDILESAALTRALAQRLAPTIPTNDNPAKSLALKLKDKIPLVIDTDAPGVVARRWKTQINENAKLVAFYDSMPELCHNTNVGMERVWRQRDILAPIFLQSSFSHPRNRLRMDIVSKIFRSAKLPVETVTIHPPGSPLAEALQMVMLGDYVSFYLAILAGVDPTPVAAIEQLKKELAEHPTEP